MKAPYRIPFESQFLPQLSTVGGAGWDDPVWPFHPGYWAYDFGFPEGYTIRAARSGTVINTIKHRVKNIPNDTGGNFVFIQHFDGTVASYAHLMTNEVYVEKDQY